MIDESFVRYAAALLRETGRLDVRAGRGGEFRRISRERAERLLRRVPSVARFADAVGAAIVDDAAAAWERAGIASLASEHPDVPPASDVLPLAFAPAPPAEPDIERLRADAQRRVTALDAALDALAPQDDEAPGAFASRLLHAVSPVLAETPLGDNPVARRIALLDVATFVAQTSEAAALADRPNEPFLFVVARLAGVRDLLRAHGPAHGARLARFADEMAARVFDALADAGPGAFRRAIPGNGSAALLPNRDETKRSLSRVRAEIERDALAEFEGAVVPVITWRAFAPTALADGDAVAAALDADAAARLSTPFQDALAGAGAFGPFALPAAAEASAVPAKNGVIAVAVVAIDARRRGDDPAADGALPFLAHLTANLPIQHLVDRAPPSIELVPWCGDLLLARGEIGELSRFLHRMAQRCRRLAGAASGPGADVAAGVAPCVAGKETAAWRSALGALERATDDPRRGRAIVLGASVATRALDRHVAMGEALAHAAEEHPGAIAALAAAVARIEDEVGLPVSAIDRLKARIHEIAAMLGVDDRVTDGGRSDAGLDALRALVRDLPRRFENGEARFALDYALLVTRARAVHPVEENR